MGRRSGLGPEECRDYATVAAQGVPFFPLDLQMQPPLLNKKLFGIKNPYRFDMDEGIVSESGIVMCPRIHGSCGCEDIQPSGSPRKGIIHAQ